MIVRCEYDDEEAAALERIRTAGGWADVESVHRSALEALARHLELKLPARIFRVGRRWGDKPWRAVNGVTDAAPSAGKTASSAGRVRGRRG